MAHFRLTKRETGHSLSEFGLIIGLVSIVGIGSLVALSQNVNGLLTNTIVSKPPTQGALTGQTTNPPAASGNPLSGYSPDIPPPAPNQTQYCNEAGLCVNLFNIKEGATVQDVSGTNGGEDLIYGYSDNLKWIAKQLAEQGVDPSLVSRISNLAKKGHALGDTFPQIMKDCKPVQTQGSENKCFNIERKAASASRNVFSIKSQANSAFFTEWQSVKEAISAQNITWYYTPKDKALFDILDHHVTQIGKISEGFGQDTVNELSPTEFLSEFNIKNQAKLNTHHESNGICQTGGDMQQCFRPVVPPLENVTQQAASN